MNKHVQKKVDEVNSLAELIKESKVVLSFKYQGLNVETFNELRRDMRKNGCSVKIIKNNISRRATSSLGFLEYSKTFVGPIAMVFSKDDIIAPSKTIFNFAKTNKQVEVLEGIIDGEHYDFNKLQMLANTPDRDTLLTQLAYSMLGSLNQLAIGLNMLSEEK